MLRRARMRALALSLPLLLVIAGDSARDRAATTEPAATPREAGAPTAPTAPGAPTAPAPAATAVADTLAAVRFVPNQGQWASAVRYAVLGDTLGWLHDDGFSVRFERWDARAEGPHVRPRASTGGVVRTHFVGGAAPTFAAGVELPTRHNFFVGADRDRWRADVPAYAGVVMRGVLPGIDVQFRPLPGGRRGAFEYDLLLAPGAELARFTARCEGVERLSIDADGRLRARLAGLDDDLAALDLVQEAPVAWQETPAGPRPLRVEFRLIDATTYGFTAVGLDPALAAVVDPGVVWGTFLGGGLTDSVNALRWREGVGVWAAGWASSTDFPVTAGAFRTTGGADAFVARLADDGASLVYATYLGGAQAEEIRGIDLGPNDTPTVVGYTRSPDFPVTAGALQATYRGGSPFLDLGDAFVARLSATGAALLGSTYLGGIFDDVGEDVVVDAVGNATVVGWSSSSDYPTTAGAYQTALAGVPGAQTDGFFTRVAANAQSLLFSTFVGGDLNDNFVALDRDAATGDWLATGWSMSGNYPTTPNVVRPSYSGLVDAVVTRLNANGTGVVFSTYLGAIDIDYGYCLSSAADGSVWIGGTTASPNYPLSLNAPQTTPGGGFDGFVTRLSANGQVILFSTRLGGPGPDRVRGVDAAAAGIAVVGEAGDGFPVTPGAVQDTFGGGMLDGFLTHLTNGGATLAYSSYFGGVGQDVLGSVELSNGGLAVLGGWSFSPDFPLVQPALQAQLRGVEDGVVLKFDFVATFGDGLVVTSDSPDDVVVVDGGERELLAARLHNLTARELVVDEVRVHVAGAGDAPARCGPLRLWRDEPGSASQPLLVGGPAPLPGDDREVAIPLSGCVLAPGATIVLRVVADLAADPSGVSSEIAASIVAVESWTMHASGAGSGPEVRVVAPGRATGPVWTLGAIPGDVDGDGTRTAVDVRRQLAQPGATHRAGDCDGDGVVTALDAAATREALLGRATVFAPPTSAAAGSWLLLRGLFPDRALQATLSGQVLVQGRATPRELTLLVPTTLPPGLHEFVLSVGGRILVNTLVQVQ